MYIIQNVSVLINPLRTQKSVFPEKTFLEILKILEPAEP